MAIKAAAALSGLLLWAWVALHALGLLAVFGPAADVDQYAAMLHARPGLLWTMRAGLLTVALAHVSSVALLARRARRARGPSGRRAYLRASLASRAMRAGGVLLLVFIVLHVLHMTTGALHPSFEPGRVHDNLVRGLASPFAAAGYLLAACALGVHLLHGLWSATRSLGLNEPRARRLQRPLGALLALALTVGFAAVPLAVMTGALR